MEHNIQNDTVSAASKSTFRRLLTSRWLRITSVLTIIIAVAGYLYVQQVAKRNFQQQLSASFSGPVEIGSAGLDWNGAVARNIKLFTDQKSTKPFATIDSLSARAPLSDLIAGKSPQTLTFEGLKLNLDMDSAGNLQQLPLVESDQPFKLPASIVHIENSQVTISQAGKSNWLVEEVELELAESDQQIKIAGDAFFLDAKWKLNGTVAEQLTELQVQANEWKIDSKRLAESPGVPAAILEPVNFSGVAATTIKIQKQGNQPLDVQADLVPRDLQFSVPKFDLAMNIASADVHFDNQQMFVKEAKAEIGGGQVLASGNATFDLPAVTGDFEAELDDVALSSVHTLASIPKAAAGNVQATGTGNFSLNQNNGFHLDLVADGILYSASYEDIPLEPTQVNVQLTGLELLKRSYEFQSLTGKVDIKTHADKLDIYHFFTNLGLLDKSNTTLAKQFGGRTDADIQLGIPLSTAGNLRSWNLTATTTSGSIDLASEQLKNVQSTIRFIEGNVAVEKLSGTSPHSEGDSTPATDQEHQHELDDAAHRFYVTGTWPLPRQAAPINPTGAFPEANTPESSTAIDFNPQEDDVDAKADDSADSQASTTDFSQEESPLASSPNGEDNAVFEIEGTEVSIPWLLSIAKDYNVDAAEILDQFLPESESNLNALDGHLTVNAKLSIPTESASDFATWNVVVDIVSGDLVFADQNITGLTGKFELKDKVVSLTNIQANLPGNEEIRVNARVPFDGAQAANIQAKLPAVPTQGIVALGRQISPEFANVADQLGFGTDPPIDGFLKLDLLVNRPAAANNQPSPWDVDLKFQSDRLTIKDKPVQRLDGQVVVDRQKIQIPKLNLDFSDGSSIKTKGQWPLNSDNLDQATGQLEIDAIKVPLQWVLNLVPDGEQNLGFWDQQLERSMSDESMRRFDLWAEEREQSEPLSTTDLGLAQYVSGSQLSGKLIVKQAKNQQTVKVKGDLKANPLQLRFGRSSLDSDPIELQLTATISPEKIDNSEFDLIVKSLAGHWNEQDVSGITARLQLVDSFLRIDAQANLLDGGLKLEGSVPIDSKSEKSEDGTILGQHLKLTLDAIKLKQLLFALSPQTPPDWNALIDSTIDFQFMEDEIVVDDGTLSVKNLVWQQNRLSDLFTLNFSLSNNILTLDNFRGDLAGGQATGNIRLAIEAGAVGDYELNIRRTNLRILGRSLRDLYPDVDNFSGFADVRVRGNLGRTVNGVGTIGFTDAVAWDMGVKQLKLPVRFQLDPMNLAGKVEFRQSQFRAFGGTIRGKGKVEFGRRIDIDVDADLNRISSDQLIGSFAGRESLGQGEIFGSLKLDGTSIQSLRDLDGHFIGRIERSRSFQIPLLRNMAIFLNSGQLTQKQFDSDDVVLRLANGHVNVERLTFVSDAAQLLVTGNVTTEGRLDLEVAARIANLSGSRQLYERLSGSPVAILASPAGAAVTQVTEFLSNRIIYLHVGGTANHPNFRVRTGQIIRDQVVQQFFSATDRQFVANLQGSR